MPREAVRGVDLSFEGEPRGEDIVDVRWSRESGDVQVVTRRTEHELADAWAIIEGPNVENPEVSASPGTTVTMSSAGDTGGLSVEEAREATLLALRGGYYVSLDRRGINDLIRNLRRARDQAFGRDE